MSKRKTLCETVTDQKGFIHQGLNVTTTKGGGGDDVGILVPHISTSLQQDSSHPLLQTSCCQCSVLREPSVLQGSPVTHMESLPLLSCLVIPTVGRASLTRQPLQRGTVTEDCAFPSDFFKPTTAPLPPGRDWRKPVWMRASPLVCMVIWQRAWK